MDTPSPLADQLAQRALDETDGPAAAVSSLMSAAAIILQRGFGPHPAAEMLVNMVIEARLALLSQGKVSEPSRH